MRFLLQQRQVEEESPTGLHGGYVNFSGPIGYSPLLRWSH